MMILEMKTQFPDAGQVFYKLNKSFPMRDRWI